MPAADALPAFRPSFAHDRLRDRALERAQELRRRLLHAFPRQAQLCRHHTLRRLLHAQLVWCGPLFRTELIEERVQTGHLLHRWEQVVALTFGRGTLVAHPSSLLSAPPCAAGPGSAAARRRARICKMRTLPGVSPSARPISAAV